MKKNILMSILITAILISGCLKQEQNQDSYTFNVSDQIKQGNMIVKVIETPPKDQIIPLEETNLKIKETPALLIKVKKSSKINNNNNNLKTEQITNPTSSNVITTNPIIYNNPSPPTNNNNNNNNNEPISTVINTTITNNNSNTPVNNTNPIINNTSPPPIKKEYPWHNNAYTTQFYIGTPGTTGAGAWDMNLLKHYGGIDDPIKRNGYYPLNFKPKENPFYYALPYSDFDSNGIRRTNTIKIPWYTQVSQSTSLVKNRWIEVKYKNKTCYGQWEDCGPVASDHLECDDFAYVFGNAQQPSITPTKENFKPALDVSPSMSDCLGMDAPNDLVFGHTDDYTSWRFIDEADVPAGPWKEIGTTSQIDWN